MNCPKSARKERGFAEEKLARESLISKSRISFIENDLVSATQSERKKLSDALAQRRRL